MIQLQLELTNMQKQVEVLTSTEQQELQQEQNEGKKGALMELKGSFEEVVAHKDSVIDSMRKNISEYRWVKILQMRRILEMFDNTNFIIMELQRKSVSYFPGILKLITFYWRIDFDMWYGLIVSLLVTTWGHPFLNFFICLFRIMTMLHDLMSYLPVGLSNDTMIWRSTGNRLCICFNKDLT